MEIACECHPFEYRDVGTYHAKKWKEYFGKKKKPRSKGSKRWQYPCRQLVPADKKEFLYLLPQTPQCEGLHMLATEKNCKRQMVHFDIDPNEMQRSRTGTNDVGFGVIPITEAGANLDVLRWSHRAHLTHDGTYFREEFPRELTTVEVPYGCVLFCHPRLAHAGSATPDNQPADGRPRFHFYAGKHYLKTFKVKHPKGFKKRKPRDIDYWYQPHSPKT